MINFPIAIVLYHPSKSSIERIIRFLQQGYIIYIFDNSIDKNITFSTGDYSNLYYYNFGKNLGLSFSINYLCNAALSNNVKNLLFFDQDTVFNIESLEYINSFISLEDSNSLFFTNVLSVNFRDSESVQSRLNTIDTGALDEFTYYSVYFNINSGTLYFLDHFRKFTWFEADYFVDGVDYCFSLNSIINQFKNIVVIGVPGLDHKEEQGDTDIKVFGINISGRAYPIKRNLDFLRSHIMLLKKSFKIKSAKPKLFLLKAMSTYIFGQILFRLNKIFTKDTYK